MSNAEQYHPHYTSSDYEQWEGDWELWSGIPVSMSPSTEKKDRTAKRALYESNGVPFYAIIDPERQTTRLMELQEGVLVNRESEKGPVELKLTNHCSIQIDFGNLF